VGPASHSAHCSAPCSLNSGKGSATRRCACTDPRRAGPPPRRRAWPAARSPRRGSTATGSRPDRVEHLEPEAVPEEGLPRLGVVGVDGDRVASARVDPLRGEACVHRPQSRCGPRLCRVGPDRHVCTCGSRRTPESGGRSGSRDLPAFHGHDARRSAGKVADQPARLRTGGGPSAGSAFWRRSRRRRECRGLEMAGARGTMSKWSPHGTSGRCCRAERPRQPRWQHLRPPAVVL
jgi:hypothetical protein